LTTIEIFYIGVDSISLKATMFKFNLFESKYFPLLCVFLSGLGFSIQILVVRMLAFRHFSASLTLIFYRALIQMLFCATVMYHNHRKQYPNGPKIFGDNRWTSFLLVCRGLIGFVGIVFGLMAAEKLPIGDATVILMLGPTVASVAGIIFLGEPWMLAECIGTVLSLVGVTLVSRPSFIFGGVSESLSTIGVIFAIINSFASGMSVMRAT
jgi:drug/metabolite transporter (DMT)-like permease